MEYSYIYSDLQILKSLAILHPQNLFNTSLDIFLFMKGYNFPNFTAPRKPMNLNVLGITCNQLNLTWTAPRNTGGLPIINYEIKYRELPGGVFTAVTSTEAIVTLENLLPETTYEIRVRANNSIISDTNTKIMNKTTKRTQGEFKHKYCTKYSTE